MWSTTERSRISWPGLFPRIHSAVFAFLIMGSFTPISAQQLDTLPKKSTQQLDTLPKKKAKPAADTDTSKAL